MEYGTAVGIAADEFTDIWVMEAPDRPGRPSLRVRLSDKSDNPDKPVYVLLPPLNAKEGFPGTTPVVLTEEEIAAERLEWIASLRAAREELLK